MLSYNIIKYVFCFFLCFDRWTPEWQKIHTVCENLAAAFSDLSLSFWNQTVPNPFLKTITRKELPCSSIVQYIWIMLELHQELHLAATEQWQWLKKDCGYGYFEGKHYRKKQFEKDSCWVSFPGCQILVLWVRISGNMLELDDQWDSRIKNQVLFSRIAFRTFDHRFRCDTNSISWIEGLASEEGLGLGLVRSPFTNPTYHTLLFAT